jgi:diguanylate cyclase (GGDEF)-like protein
MPSVDELPYSDNWGEFYSAYSPVFDSSGRVAGIVAVDFSKQWYDSKVAPMFWTTVITSASSLLVAAALIITITSRNRQRIRVVNLQLNELADNFERLMQEVRNMSGVNVSGNTGDTATQLGSVKYEGDDDIESMRMKILALHDELHTQIEKVKAQAYLDGMTGVKNKTSYLQTEKHINETVQEGTAAFSVIVLDMNGLKGINDELGHEYGDMAIIDATNALASVYDKGNIYRIGGDEFIVILNTISEEEIKNSISRLDYRIAHDNATEKPYKRPLSISVGYAIFDKNSDHEYKDVFHRADKQMYEDKAAYYKKNGDPRRR